MYASEVGIWFDRSELSTKGMIWSNGYFGIEIFTFITFTSIIKFINYVISKTFTHWSITQMKAVASITPVSSKRLLRYSLGNKSPVKTLEESLLELTLDQNLYYKNSFG